MVHKLLILLGLIRLHRRGVVSDPCFPHASSFNHTNHHRVIALIYRVRVRVVHEAATDLHLGPKLVTHP